MDRGADIRVAAAEPFEQRLRADGAESSETLIEVAMICLILNRLARGV
jgi:hypothetical protein